MTDDGKMNVDIDPTEMGNVMKKYKKIKKYMRSPLYEIKRMDKTEKVVTNLLKELETVSESTKELD